MTSKDSFHEVAFNISFWTRNISSARILFWRGVIVMSKYWHNILSIPLLHTFCHCCIVAIFCHCCIHCSIVVEIFYCLFYWIILILFYFLSIYVSISNVIFMNDFSCILRFWSQSISKWFFDRNLHPAKKVFEHLR